MDKPILFKVTEPSSVPVQNRDSSGVPVRQQGALLAHAGGVLQGLGPVTLKINRDSHVCGDRLYLAPRLSVDFQRLGNKRRLLILFFD